MLSGEISTQHLASSALAHVYCKREQNREALGSVFPVVDMFFSPDMVC